MILHDFSPQNGSRNQGEVGGDPIDLFCGGGPPKRPPKSKVFRSVFRYLKVEDFDIITLWFISLLLDSY